jgi:hypothetical protein
VANRHQVPDMRGLNECWGREKKKRTVDSSRDQIRVASGYQTTLAAGSHTPEAYMQQDCRRGVIAVNFLLQNLRCALCLVKDPVISLQPLSRQGSNLTRYDSNYHWCVCAISLLIA